MTLQKIIAAFIALVAFGASAEIDEGTAKHYGTLGQFILTNLPSAPFPHPDRAQGHSYDAETFSADEHYRDNSVGIFIPKGIQPTNTLDLIFHFHGWRNSVTNVLIQYQLIDQLTESGRKAVLVVPQGPLNAADSFGGKLEDDGGFERFLADVVSLLQRDERFKDVQPGKIILSGHSGGYQVMSSILAQEKTNRRIQEVWLFDGLYGRAEKFTGWFNKQTQCRFVNVYTATGGTKNETEKLMSDLRAKRIPFFAGNENSVSPAELQTNKVIFLFSDLAHDDVLEKRRTFHALAKTSSLEPIPNHRIIVAPRNRQVPGQRFPLKVGSLYIPDYFKAERKPADVLIFFHGAAWCAEQNLYDAQKNSVLVSINTNGFGRFHDAKEFNALLANVSEVLNTNRICTNGIGSVSLASFSAGQYPVSLILSQKELAKRIHAVILADSLYPWRDKKNTNRVAAEAMEPFLKFAQRAASGKGEFWFSQLYPLEEKYRSNTTTLAANYLIKKVRAKRRPGNMRNSQGAFAIYRADKGDFHVIGYEGMSNQDHLDHFYALSDLLRETRIGNK